MAAPTLSDKLRDYAYFSLHPEEYLQAAEQLPNITAFFPSESDVQQFINYMSSRIYTINRCIFKKEMATQEQRHVELARLRMEYVSSWSTLNNVFNLITF